MEWKPKSVDAIASPSQNSILNFIGSMIRNEVPHAHLNRRLVSGKAPFPNHKVLLILTTARLLDDLS